LYHLSDVKDVVIDTGNVVFPKFDVCGKMSFFFPYNMPLGDKVLEYVTAQPLCRIENTYFFVAIEGIDVKYKFRESILHESKQDSNQQFEKINLDGIQVVTLNLDQARYLRKLDGKLYLGNNCDLYLCDGEIHSAEDGEFCYYEWNGTEFIEKYSGQPNENAVLTMTDCEEKFIPPYVEELELGGLRKRSWKKISVDSPNGMVSIIYEGDVAQIYADGTFIADEFYKGTPWRIPASLLFRKECYLVVSEMKDDFYREF